MRLLLFILAITLFSNPSLFAQTGTAFSMKGGLTLGSQKWNGSERDILPAYHGALAIESVNDSMSLSFFAQIGYHVKGSAQRFDRFWNPNTMEYSKGRTFRYPYEQASLVLGAKNTHNLGAVNGYYLLALRLDYLLRYRRQSDYYNNGTAPVNDGFDQYVNKFNYGATIGGGFEYSFKNFPAAIFAEFTINPDLSKQVFLPGNTVEAYNPSQNSYYIYPEQKVNNLSYEISLGVKFIRKVTWVEEWEDDALLPMHRMVKKG